MCTWFLKLSFLQFTITLNLFIFENDNTICVLSIDAAKNLNLNEEYNGLHLR